MKRLRAFQGHDYEVRASYHQCRIFISMIAFYYLMELFASMLILKQSVKQSVCALDVKN